MWFALCVMLSKISVALKEPFPSCPDGRLMVTIDVNQVTHMPSKTIMGCHLDSGYGFETQGLHSQMLHAPAFELGPPSSSTPGRGNDTSPEDRPYGVGWLPLGNASGLTFSARGGPAGGGVVSLQTAGTGVANRGLGMEGLHLQADHLYEGYILVQAQGVASIEISLEDFEKRTVLADRVLKVELARNWTKVHFSLTPSDGTPCAGSRPFHHGSGPTCHRLHGTDNDSLAHVCVSCPGQLAVRLKSGTAVSLGYVFFEPGPWARVNGLSLLRSGAAALQEMGVTLLRAGGTFAQVFPDYFWKRLRYSKEPWKRPPETWGGPTSTDHPHGTNEVITGFGPFEIMDMCDALGIEAVITTAAVGATPADMGDIVEYCYGNSSTIWGRKRIVEDDHPEPYHMRWVELGNEQQNPAFVEQVVEMEARAALVGIPRVLRYIYPSGGGDAGTGGPANKSEATAAGKLGLGARLAVDVHVYAGGGVRAAEAVFTDPILGPGMWGAANLETNCGDHTMHRALIEAQDMMTFLRYPNARLTARAGSFCFERSGYNEGGWNDQGFVFYLPNMTWLQPPGHVHSMLHKMWQPRGLKVTLEGCEHVHCGSPSGEGGDDTRCALATAQAAEDGSIVVVQLLNMGDAAIEFTLAMVGARLPQTAHALVLGADSLSSVNTPSEPSKVSPVSALLELTNGKIKLPRQTFAVLRLEIEGVQLV
eukprot:TRINITY_DN49653_c0_g1_i1.p1 TRINITY_DN49653_c0_g1~~TRINITY_DN49653_c0_g1_i1.p1  ORF type:complete len:705 (-),score=59.15 TRINITY_DN49653_c0_g1_i1:16-2130(-)